MKAGANSTDQIMIKHHEADGLNADEISSGLGIEIDVVKNFMTSVDQEIETDEGFGED